MEALRAELPLSTSEQIRENLRSPSGPVALAAAVLFVGGVSFYDGYLVIRTGDMIVEYEKNPVGLYLIKFNHNDPSLFLRLKAAGTILVLSALIALHRRSPRMAAPVWGALVFFQSGLMVCLEM